MVRLCVTLCPVDILRKDKSLVQAVKVVAKINISDLLPSIRSLDLQGIEVELRDVEVQLRKSITDLIELKRLEMSRWSSEEIENGANEQDIMSKILSLEGEDRLNDDQQMGVVFVYFLHLSCSSTGLPHVYRFLVFLNDLEWLFENLNCVNGRPF